MGLPLTDFLSLDGFQAEQVRDLPEKRTPEMVLKDQIWKGDDFQKLSVPSIQSGYARLDEELPGRGWPTYGLNELLLAHFGIGELRLLMPALKRVSQSGRPIIVVAPSEIASCLYAPAWHHAGVELSRILIVEPQKPVDRLWAIEQSLKSNAFGALLAWLPAVTRWESMRRLQVAASAANGLSFVIRSSQCHTEPTPAPLRLFLQKDSPSKTGRGLKVSFLKRRGLLIGKSIRLELPEVRPIAPKHNGEKQPRIKTTHALDRNTMPYSLSRSAITSET